MFEKVILDKDYLELTLQEIESAAFYLSDLGITGIADNLYYICHTMRTKASENILVSGE